MSDKNLHKLVIVIYGIYFSSFIILCTLEILEGNTGLINTLLTAPLYILYALISVAAMILIDYISDQGIFRH